MAMKGYSAFPKAPALTGSSALDCFVLYQGHFIDAVDVFYSPSRLSKSTHTHTHTHTHTYIYINTCTYALTVSCFFSTSTLTGLLNAEVSLSCKRKCFQVTISYVTTVRSQIFNVITPRSTLIQSGSTF